MPVTYSGPKYDPTVDIPNLTGKVAIVTGGNAGIGYHTVAELARHGAKVLFVRICLARLSLILSLQVYMGARNEGRANSAIAQMEADGVLKDGNGQIVWLKLDLNDPVSVKATAEEFMQRETRLDILGKTLTRPAYMTSS